jgi:hypothetical protein
VDRPPVGDQIPTSRPLKKANSLKGEDAKPPVFRTRTEFNDSGAARKHGKTTAKHTLSRSGTSDPARTLAPDPPLQFP